jgi:hypothetical protein
MGDYERMKSDLERMTCNSLKFDDMKIMAQAAVFLRGEPAAAVELRRGMIVKCNEGREAGKLAGVVVSQATRQVLCLILSHLPDKEGYQSLPVSWIECVNEDVITLTARFEMILTLPDWHST